MRAEFSLSGENSIDISARLECIEIRSFNDSEIEVFNSCFRPLAFWVAWSDDQNIVRSKYRTQARRSRTIQRRLLSGTIFKEEEINPEEGNDAIDNTKLDRDLSSGFTYITNVSLHYICVFYRIDAIASGTGIIVSQRSQRQLVGNSDERITIISSRYDND